MPLQTLARHPRKIAALAVVGLVVLAGLGYLVQTGTSVADIFAKLKDIAQLCTKINPVAYILALAVLPYVGVPSSLFYTVAGNAYGLKMALCWTTLGLALNLVLGYFIGSRWLRVPIENWLEKRGRHLPEVPPGEYGKLIVLTRIIPGPPLVAQNFLLALAGVPLAKYFFYSLPITVLYAIGICLAARGLFQGNVKLLVYGVAAMVALGLLAHVANAMYKSRLRKNQPPTVE